MDSDHQTPIRILGDTELRALNIDQRQILDAVEGAIRDQVAGRVWTSPKSSLVPGAGRYVMSTLSASDDPPISVVKVVTVSPDNPGLDLPAINGSIILHDSRNGLLCAVMDAAWITAVRTAGLSAVVARRLANPDAGKIGFVGAGVQAQSHLEMFASLFPLRGVSVFGRGRKNIDRLKSRAEKMGLQVQICTNARDAVAGADLIVTSVTATTLKEPFLDAAWLKPGAFAAIVDLGASWRAETMPALGRIVIDDPSYEAAGAQNMVDPALVTDHLAGVVMADDAGHDPASSAAFIFRGLAIGDFAVAALVWRLLQS